MPKDLLVDIAMPCLESPHYRHDVEKLQFSHSVTGSSYDTLDTLHDGINHLDSYFDISFGN
jgi:hypothetical protein